MTTSSNVFDLDKKLGWQNRATPKVATVEAVMFGRSWNFIKGISDYHQMRLFMAAEPEASDILAYLHTAVVEEQRPAWLKQWSVMNFSIEDIIAAVREIADLATSAEDVAPKAAKRPVKKAPARVQRV